MKALITICLSIFTLGALAQGPASLCWRGDQRGDSTCTQASFDSLINVYTKKLSNNETMATADYVLTVKLDNTIHFNLSRICHFASNKLYNHFSQLCSGRAYFDKLTQYLGVCIPNRGMGCYYAAYKLDWGGGGPNSNSLLKVVP